MIVTYVQLNVSSVRTLRHPNFTVRHKVIKMKNRKIENEKRT